MTERLRSSADNLVHFGSPDGNDYFLCGFAYEGEDGRDCADPTRGRVNCPRCIEVVRFCKTIKTREMRKAI